MKLPAFQFYPGDWLKDPQLSMCSPATRGVWIDLLCAMHELGRSGQVTGTVDQLCRLCRCTAAEMSAALAELDSTKTASISERNGTVTVISRRMQREHKDRVSTNNRVKKHRGHGDVTDVKRNGNGASSSSTSNTVTDVTGARAPNIWDVGVPLLRGAGMTEPHARSLLGKLVKDYGDEKVASAIAVTSRKERPNAKDYLVATLSKDGPPARTQAEVNRPGRFVQ